MHTYTSNILSALVNREVSVGDIINVEVNRIMAHDGTGPVVSGILDSHQITKLDAANRTVFIYDHYYPPATQRESDLQSIGRNFAKRYGIPVYQGQGIAHQLIAEKAFVTPGTILVGADSHTCTAGALGAFAMGVGATDVAASVATGQIWLKVPDTLRIRLVGQLPNDATSQDLILTIISKIGTQGALGKAIEFVGPAIKYLGISDRLKLANHAVEMGAITGIFGFDSITQKWLEAREGDLTFVDRVRHDNLGLHSDIEFDLSTVCPKVALPSKPDLVIDRAEIKGRILVNQVYIGSCAGGRIDDLRAAAEILKGKHIAEGLRLLVAPASAEIAANAIEEGIVAIFLKAGATILPPGCGACMGWIGTLGDGEVEVSTQNRNFVGRAGSTKASIYLSSSITAAKIALKGVLEKEISDENKR